jgi:Protein of unknown function (DUF2877)
MTPSAVASVIDIGPVAHDVVVEALPSGAKGEVVAVFDNSCYVRTPGGLACIGTRGIGAGPLNLRLELGERQTWRGLGILVEMVCTGREGTLSIGPDIDIRLGDAAIWAPPPLPQWTMETLQSGLAAAQATAAERCPHDGLARLVFAPGRAKPSNPHANAARVPFEALRQALGPALSSGTLDADLTSSATLLLGLGPGLTPSGDDVLGGLMIALTALGQTHLRDQLWDALRPELDMLTNEISAMHLAVAADGLGSNACHTALNAMLSGSAPDLEEIDAIGHTSGWDMLAGIVLALSAACGSQT